MRPSAASTPTSDPRLRLGNAADIGEISQAPPEVIDLAVRAARPIGDGFYGVDIKQTDSGFVVKEVNDNPNLEHGIEDTVGKDEIWIKLLKWFTDRFEQ